MKRVLGFGIPLLAVMVAGWVWWSANSSSSIPSIKRITIGTFSKALGNSPYHVAKSRKLFESNPALNGIEIVHVEYNDRAAISQAFDKGELQVLFSAEIPSILCYAQGNDIYIVEISGVAAQEIIVPTNSPIQKVADLKGQQLAVLPGTSSHYCLLKVLKQNSMTPEDLSLSYMSPGEAKVAFETGKLTAWAVWAPWVEQEEVAGLGKPIADSKADIASVMTMSGPFVRKHIPEARAVLETIRQSKEWTRANTDAAQQIVAKDIALDIAVVRQAWPKFNWAANLNRSFFPDFQDKAAFLASDKKTRLSREVKMDDLVKLDLDR